MEEKSFYNLDAVGFENDYYTNNVDWNESNGGILTIALDSTVYGMNMTNNKIHTVAKVDEILATSAVPTYSVLNDKVTSLTSSPDANKIAIGTFGGSVQVWNVETQTKVFSSNKILDHKRICAMAWSKDTPYVFITGSNDGSIHVHDIRENGVGGRRQHSYSMDIESGHQQTICNLKWSDDGMNLASGGNDNKLLVWSPYRSNKPVVEFKDHSGAVKAMAWCPYNHNLLASGGGHADKRICIRSIVGDDHQHQRIVQEIQTSGQVCGLFWIKPIHGRASHIISCHGDIDSSLSLWSVHPKLNHVQTLKKQHSMRALFVQHFIHPTSNRDVIMTVSGDEIIQFRYTTPSSIIETTKLYKKRKHDFASINHNNNIR